MAAAPPDWLRLQKKIFTRWVNQKLTPRKVKIDDVVTDLKNGWNLIYLVEVLSETEMPDKGKLAKDPKARMQMIDNCNKALEYTFKSGVESKLKPSAENLVDGHETSVLGLIYGIFIKFMKLEDDEEDGAPSVSFPDALKMWVTNQLTGYDNVKIQNMTKSFHNGLAFCALIHKFRPKLIDYKSLSPSDEEKNLNIAFSAAEKYFGLEKYLTCDDIKKLDDKSMVVYLSEYYYGIAQQRKVDLAARRIHKLIEFTQENDKLRADYKSIGGQLVPHFDKVEKLLNDIVSDNTMAGIKKRLAEFHDFKKQDKGTIFREFFSLETIFQNLARRLLQHKRPEFKAAAGQSVPELRTRLTSMEAKEKERNIALNKEMNRQIKLAKIYEDYSIKYNEVKQWAAEKKAYLTKKVEVLSVGAAKYQLNVLSAYMEESKNMSADRVAKMCAQAKELLDEKFEHSSTVSSREHEISESMKELAAAAAHKKLIHEDDLARETYKAKVRGWNEDHKIRHSKLSTFIAEKTTYLKRKEVVHSSIEAQLQLSLLEGFNNEKKDLTANIAPLKKIGQDILAAKYQTDFSNWVFENPQEVKTREGFVDEKWHELDTLAATKLAVLQDDLAREQFKEKTHNQNKIHQDKFAAINVWITAAKTYLEKKEECNSIAQAEANLTAIAAYVADKADVTKINVASLKALGHEILTAKYASSLSQWAFENPAEVKSREADVDKAWQELDNHYKSKKGVLDADLAREIHKEELRIRFANVAGAFNIFAKDAIATSKNHFFGNLLEEIEAYQATLASLDSSINTRAHKDKAEYDKIYAELTSLHVTDNPYTTLTPKDLDAEQANLAAALKARHDVFQQVLAKARHDDALCRKFAALIDPFVKLIEANRACLSAESKETMEALLDKANKFSAEAKTDKTLGDIKAAQAELDAAGVQFNRHTLHSAIDAEVLWNQYVLFLDVRSKQLATEIEHKKLRGVSAEQYKEIEHQFKTFDKNSNGTLDKREFKACLYSLGEEKGKKEIAAVLEKFGYKEGKEVKINFDQFREFMITILGDTDTAQEIVEGFFLINRGKEKNDKELMSLVMEERDIAYIYSTHGDGDYKGWTASVFAR